MIDAEVKAFSSRLGIGELSFDENTPLCFILDGKYSYCLEYSKGNERRLNLAVEFAYDTYDLNFLEKAFASCSYESRRVIDFAVACHKDNLMLVTALSENITAGELENAIIRLKEQAEIILGKT
ncbi:MAG: hypothetical protein ACI4NE_05825 [Succinivibrio sp.]